MTNPDMFEGLARYYDSIMEHIDYDRWVVVASTIADMLPQRSFRHLDIACGTGALISKLRQHGWNSYGIDLSPSMAHEASRKPYAPQVAAADMCSLPFPDASFPFVTCVFDSLNFLLEKSQLEKALSEFQRVLTPDGIIYVDMITERMITENFSGQKWSERSGRLKTKWEGVYDSEEKILDLHVGVNKEFGKVIRERAYTKQETDLALKSAGLTLLGELDTTNWTTPTYKTLRVDMIAVKRDIPDVRKRFADVVKRVQSMLA